MALPPGWRKACSSRRPDSPLAALQSITGPAHVLWRLFLKTFQKGGGLLGHQPPQSTPTARRIGRDESRESKELQLEVASGASFPRLAVRPIPSTASLSLSTAITSQWGTGTGTCPKHSEGYSMVLHLEWGLRPGPAPGSQQNRCMANPSLHMVGELRIAVLCRLDREFLSLWRGF